MMAFVQTVPADISQSPKDVAIPDELSKSKIYFEFVLQRERYNSIDPKEYAEKALNEAKNEMLSDIINAVINAKPFTAWHARVLSLISKDFQKHQKLQVSQFYPEQVELLKEAGCNFKIISGDNKCEISYLKNVDDPNTSFEDLYGQPRQKEKSNKDNTEHNSLKYFQDLIKKKPNNLYSINIIKEAINLGNPEIMEYFIENNKYYQRWLDLMIECNTVKTNDLCEWYIKKYSDAQCSLVTAVKSGNWEMMLYLIDIGFDVSLPNSNGETSFSASNSEELTRYLLKKSPESVNDAFDWAFHHNCAELVSELIDNVTNIEECALRYPFDKKIAKIIAPKVRPSSFIINNAAKLKSSKVMLLFKDADYSSAEGEIVSFANKELSDLILKNATEEKIKNFVERGYFYGAKTKSDQFVLSLIEHDANLDAEKMVNGNGRDASHPTIIADLMKMGKYPPIPKDESEIQITPNDRSMNYKRFSEDTILGRRYLLHQWNKNEPTEEETENELRTKIFYNRISTYQKSLDSIAEAGLPIPATQTLLEIAVENNQYKAVHEILKQNKKLELKDAIPSMEYFEVLRSLNIKPTLNQISKSILELDSKKEDEFISSVLSKKDKNHNYKSDDGTQLLLNAVLYKFPKIIEIALDRGADINSHMPVIKEKMDDENYVRECKDFTPLAAAITKQNVEIVDLLLKRGADATKLAFQALNSGVGDIAYLVLKAGADVTQMSSGRNMLFYASPYPTAIAEMIIDSVDVNQVFNNGIEKETPLVAALQKKNIKLAVFLLEHGANPKVGNVIESIDSLKDSRTIDFVRKVSEAGVSLSNKSDLLSLACDISNPTNRLRTINSLLELGVKPSKTDNKCLSTLLSLNNITIGDIDAAKKFIEMGVPLSGKNMANISEVFTSNYKPIMKPLIELLMEKNHLLLGNGIPAYIEISNKKLVKDLIELIDPNTITKVSTEIQSDESKDIDGEEEEVDEEEDENNNNTKEEEEENEFQYFNLRIMNNNKKNKKSTKSKIVQTKHQRLFTSIIMKYCKDKLISKLIIQVLLPKTTVETKQEGMDAICSKGIFSESLARELIENGIDLKECKELVTAAIRDKCSDFALEMIEAGAPWNSKAVSFADTKTLPKFLELGVDVNTDEIAFGLADSDDPSILDMVADRLDVNLAHGVKCKVITNDPEGVDKTTLKLAKNNNRISAWSSGGRFNRVPDPGSNLSFQHVIVKLTLLQHCIKYRKTNSALWLINHGAALDVSQNTMFHPIHFASKKGLLPVVKALVEKGEKINSRGDFWDTPVTVAYMYEQEGVLRFYQSLPEYSKRMLQLKERRKKWMFLEIVKKGNVATVKDMLEINGMDPNPVRENCPESPLLQGAVDSNNAMMVRCLLEHGAHPSSTILKNAYGEVLEVLLDYGIEGGIASVLRKCIKRHNIRMLRILATKFDLIKEFKNRCPLHLTAYEFDEISLAKELIDSGSPISKGHKQEKSQKEDVQQGYPMFGMMSSKATTRTLGSRRSKIARGNLINAIVEKNDFEMLNFLVGRPGIDGAIRSTGNDLLFLMTIENRSRMVTALLRLGANPAGKDDERNTCLINSVRYNDVENVRLMFSKEIKHPLKASDINMVKTYVISSWNNTTESNCALFNVQSAEMMQILIDNGADLSIRDSYGGGIINNCLNDKKLVELLISHNVNINYPGKNGYTPLISSLTKRSDDEIAKMLVEAGASLSYCLNSKPALWHAIDGGKEDVALLMMDKGANYLQEIDGVSVLEYALRNKCSKIVTYLVEHGVEVTPKAFSAAAGTCNVSVLEKMIELGADPSDTTSPPLVTAAENGRKENVEFLIDHGADINATDDDGQSPLLIATRRGESDMALLLIEKGAKLEVRDRWMWTPLSQAVNKGLRSVVEALANKGANLNAKACGKYPLQYAISHNNVRIADILIEHGADILREDKKNGTSLDFSIANGDRYTTANLIMHLKRLPKKPLRSGNTLMYEAARSCFPEAIWRAIELGCNVNEDINPTSIFKAAATASADDNDIVNSCELILENGFDVKKWNPMNAAIKAGSFRLISMLKKRGFEIPDDSLRISIRNGNMKFTKFLLNEGIKMRPEYIHYAARSGYVEMFKFVLENGGNPRSKLHGNTILHSAYRGVVGFVVTDFKWSNDPPRKNEIVKMAEEITTDLNALNNKGENVLMTFAKGKQRKVEDVKLLLKAGVDYSLVSTKGVTALYSLIEGESDKAAAVLAKMRINLDVAPEGRPPPLFLATQKNLRFTVRALIQMGARRDIEFEGVALADVPTKKQKGLKNIIITGQEKPRTKTDDNRDKKLMKLKAKIAKMHGKTVGDDEEDEKPIEDEAVALRKSITKEDDGGEYRSSYKYNPADFEDAFKFETRMHQAVNYEDPEDPADDLEVLSSASSESEEEEYDSDEYEYVYEYEFEYEYEDGDNVVGSEKPKQKPKPKPKPKPQQKETPKPKEKSKPKENQKKEKSKPRTPLNKTEKREMKNKKK